MKKLIYVVLIVAVALFGLTFSYKNHQFVELNYYFGLHFQGRLPLLLLITFALGLLVGYIAALFHGFNARRKLRRRPQVSQATGIPLAPRRMPPVDCG